MMTKQIEELNLSVIGRLADDMTSVPQQPAGDGYYVDENLFIFMGKNLLAPKAVQLHTPYHVEEGRVLMVTSGWVRMLINLEEYRMEEHSLLVIAPNSVFEVLEEDEGFAMQAFSFKDLPGSVSVGTHMVVPLADGGWKLADEFFWLLWHVVHLQPPVPEVVMHLQTAFLLELKSKAVCDDALRSRTATRRDVLFHHFLDLVGEYGLRERKIQFYADKLCITPGHLSDVVKQASGLTVMQLLNRHAVQKAKLLLRHSELPIGEIAEQLNFANPSFFSKFFKRETGMTPNAYRCQ